MHKQFLIKALDQAWLGRGICAPNPSVGAIAVQNNSIIAQAWHHGVGTAHAEQLILESIPKNTPDVTLYVTLEPCNHWGKTPPCVDAIINHGIKKVVFAYHDPNPIVALNKTPMLLKAKGIDVLYYKVPLIDEFYNSYKYWIEKSKPWVSAKMAQTFNGKIGKFGVAKDPISNAECALFTHKQRLHTDIILTTANTINIDNPLLNARINNKEYAKHVAIIDTRLKVKYNSEVFKHAKSCHIFYDDALEPPKNTSNCIFHGTPVKNNHIDLNKVICHLGTIGYHDVLVEAGGGLFTALHEQKLVNRTYIYLVPKILEEDAVNAYKSADVLKNYSKISWQAMGDNMLAVLDW
jgi:diaminohydroxyphosphoribosylaminopyrimidine deaminase/5-amino-6-(5-phosphoribosylamino)uracil reductase